MSRISAVILKSIIVAVGTAVIVLFAGVMTPSSGAWAVGRQQDKTATQKPGKPVGPDDAPTQNKDESKIRLTADLVMLDVTVTDATVNKPVLDLKEDQFQIFEDKLPQRIEVFSRDQIPASLVFAIDTSGSMKTKLDTVIAASVNLVKDGRPGDEMAVIEFKDEAELLSEFTEDATEVTDTLQALTARGRTALLDAVYLAAEYAHTEARNRRRAVVLVTDGVDKNSYYKFEQVVNRLRETDVQIYLIGFTKDLQNDGAWVFKKSEKDKAEGLLSRLAAETGGRAFFPKELAEVHAIAQQISTDLRTQYSIGYYPANSKRDGTFRAISVQVNATGNRRLVAHTRPGYTAPRGE
ncbi:MAG TPA: VWA domain-containing protein [Blastocatellia bacterium]|nr:VWA domain-containing protein [Blastocatellia bacterium]